jgi:hypothetical protein
MRAWRTHRGMASPGLRRQRQAPRSTRLGRLLRGLRPDRNPLRRGTDRAETALLAGLLAVFLAGAPLAAYGAGSWAYATSAREAQAQQAVSHQVRATLLQAAPGWDAAGIGADVQARWTAPDGQVRTGQVYAPDGAAAGSTVSIWVNRSGQITDVPLQRSQVQGRAQLSAAIAVVVTAVLLVMAGLAGRWLLDRRRLAGWDAEWLAAGTRWRPGGKTPASGD